MTLPATVDAPSQLHDGHRKAAKDLVVVLGPERARELVQSWAAEDRRYLLVLEAMDELR